MHYKPKDEDRLDEMGLPTVRTAPPVEPTKPPRLFSRMVITGMLLSVVLLLWGTVNRDVPLLFVAGAFLMNGLRPFTKWLKEPVGSFVSNMLFGFSIALFFGGIAMIFL